ncbi:MAG: hypothetical protein GY941_16820 [Planctomycetes bacterium]|nr:hypothetical protein [Planctomycetota bacterium]
MNKSKLVSDFELLRDHCILLQQNYNTYTDLYNEENRDLLDKVAPTFFSDIAEIMHRDWILQACKLMDPAKTNVRGNALENITIKLINEQLETGGLLVPCIDELSRKVLSYGEKIKPARHKRLAHFDREHQVNNITLGETTEEELFNFLSDIQNYCNEVGLAIGLGPLDFSSSGCKGDALDLVKYLRNCE